jgi:hypothetical protein
MKTIFFLFMTRKIRKKLSKKSFLRIPLAQEEIIEKFIV